jgi:hypothetical protein
MQVSSSIPPRLRASLSSTPSGSENDVFLLREVPDGRITKSVDITDRYFAGTRLRLRQIRDRTGDTTRTYYKFTQKIPAPDGRPGLLSTIYLSEEEFVLFSGLPGMLLRKTRLGVTPPATLR